MNNCQIFNEWSAPWIYYRSLVTVWLYAILFKARYLRITSTGCWQVFVRFQCLLFRHDSVLLELCSDLFCLCRHKTLGSSGISVFFSSVKI